MGFHATGVDRIVAESGIAKMTLYNYFRSKESLIVACTEDRSARVLNWIRSETLNRADSPVERFEILFDIHENWYNEPQFRGCYFQRLCAEFPDPASAPHRAAADHFSELFQILKGWAERSGLETPAARAEDILLLLEGATAIAHATGATIAARRARRALGATLN